MRGLRLHDAEKRRARVFVSANARGVPQPHRRHVWFPSRVGLGRNALVRNASGRRRDFDPSAELRVVLSLSKDEGQLPRRPPTTSTHVPFGHSVRRMTTALAGHADRNSMDS
jgi:hypothetical protein